MSPRIDHKRKKITWDCNLCNRNFDTKEDELQHEIHDHWGIPFGWGCPTCNNKHA